MPTRTRLRLIGTIPTAAATYGSGNYGDNTYGTRATDPAEFANYQIVPTAAGTDDVVWLRREWDTRPVWECRLVAFGYAEGTVAGVPMNVETIDEAWLRLDRATSGPPNTVSLPLTPVPPDILRRELHPGDLLDIAPGVYRVMVVLLFESGRRLTVPAGDEALVRISDAIGGLV